MDSRHTTGVFVDLGPRSPLAPVDRRWRLACALVKPPRRLPLSWGDTWVRRARRFLRAAARLGGETSPAAAAVDTTLAEALQIRRGGGHREVVLQAGLLAGETFEQVARRAGVDVRVVEAFEALFFAVADSLHAVDWLVATVMPDLHDGPRPSDETLALAFALRGGPLVLDAVLAALGIPCVPAGGPPAAETVRSARSAIATKQLSVEGTGEPVLVRLALLHEEQSAQREGGVRELLCQPVMPPVDDFAIARAISESAPPSPARAGLAPSVSSMSEVKGRPVGVASA